MWPTSGQPGLGSHCCTESTAGCPGASPSVVSAGVSDLASQPLLPSAVGLAAGGPDRLLSDCIEPVKNTILNARTLSTQLQYEKRLKLFSDWCTVRKDPVYFPVPTILELLQSLLDGDLSPSTMKLYVAAISAEHARVDNHMARQVPPYVGSRPCWAPVLASLWALGRARAEVTVTNTAFLPKVLAHSHLNRPIQLAWFDPSLEEGEERSGLLYPVRALRAYVEATVCIWQSEQVFVCYGGPRKGCALSKLIPELIPEPGHMRSHVTLLI